MNSLLYDSPHLLITYIDNKDEAIEYFKKHLEMEPLQSLVVGILFYKDADMIKLETSNHVFDTINAGTVPFIDKWKALFHPYKDEDDPIATTDFEIPLPYESFSADEPIKVSSKTFIVSYSQKISLCDSDKIRDKEYLRHLVYSYRRNALEKLIMDDSFWAHYPISREGDAYSITLSEQLRVIMPVHHSDLISIVEKDLRK